MRLGKAATIGAAVFVLLFVGASSAWLAYWAARPPDCDAQWEAWQRSRIKAEQDAEWFTTARLSCLADGMGRALSYESAPKTLAMDDAQIDLSRSIEERGKAEMALRDGLFR